MLSESEEGLQPILSNIYTYCANNELTVNLDETKCTTFSKTHAYPFYLGGVKLENVRSYKYLGLIITLSGEIKSAHEDLRSRGLKVYWEKENGR